jgi:hypothetical protein
MPFIRCSRLFARQYLDPRRFLREWGIDEIAHMVFQESGTDMIVSLPFTDLLRRRALAVGKCAAMAERAIF